MKTSPSSVLHRSQPREPLDCNPRPLEGTAWQSLHPYSTETLRKYSLMPQNFHKGVKSTRQENNAHCTQQLHTPSFEWAIPVTYRPPHKTCCCSKCQYWWQSWMVSCLRSCCERLCSPHLQAHSIHQDLDSIVAALS